MVEQLLEDSRQRADIEILQSVSYCMKYDKEPGRDKPMTSILARQLISWRAAKGNLIYLAESHFVSEVNIEECAYHNALKVGGSWVTRTAGLQQLLGYHIPNRGTRKLAIRPCSSTENPAITSFEARTQRVGYVHDILLGFWATKDQDSHRSTQQQIGTWK